MPVNDDPFASARSGFLGLEDLDGCLILVLPHDKETMKGDNGPYEMYRCTVTVLDGDPSEAVDGEFPIELDDFGISSAFVIPLLKRVTTTGKPVLGRVESFRNKRKTTSYKLAEPTEDDKDLARPVAIQMLQANDPFDSGPADLTAEPNDSEAGAREPTSTPPKKATGRKAVTGLRAP